MSKKRSNQHILVQRRGKERDGYVCQVCGSTQQVEGHHVFDVAFGGAASVDNIICLCHNCHQAVHKGVIDIILF